MRHRGSVLFEVSIAAGLAAIAMMAVAQLLAVSAHQELSIERRRLATQEAANALEQVLVRPWDEVTSERLAALTLPDSSAHRLPDGRLVCELEANAASPPAKQIVVEVSWRSRAGDRERVRLNAWRFHAEKRP